MLKRIYSNEHSLIEGVENADMHEPWVTCKVVEDMLVCGGKVADKLLALQVVATTFQAPELSLF